MPRSKRSKAQVEHSKKLHEASCEEAKTSAELANLAQNRVDMRSAALTRASNAPPPLSHHYRPHNTCGCDGCRAKSPGDAVPITKTILARDLRTQGAIAAELNAHGVEGAYVNGKPVFLKILRTFFRVGIKGDGELQLHNHPVAGIVGDLGDLTKRDRVNCPAMVALT